MKSIVSIFFIVVIIGSLVEIYKKHNNRFAKSSVYYEDETSSYETENSLYDSDISVETEEVSTPVVSYEPSEIETNTAKDVVYVHGFGEYDENDLYTIRQGISDFYGYDVRIGSPHTNIPSSYIVNGEYVNSFKSLEFVNQDGDGRHVYVTSQPLCVSEYNVDLISGYARYYHMGSIVSTYQLKSHGNYSSYTIQNVANHEIGHNLGLKHCENNGPCLMNATGTNIREYCEECKRKLNL